MDEKEKVFIREKVDAYVDRVQDLNEVRQFGEICFGIFDNIYVGENIGIIIEALGIEKIDTRLEISERYVNGKTENWLIKWKVFYYRGMRFSGFVYIVPEEAL